MHLEVFTLGPYLIIFLLCLTIDAPLTVKRIFEDNLNWAALSLAERDNLRDVELNEVNKMLTCKDESRGFFTYECEHCGIKKNRLFRMQQSHLHESWQESYGQMGENSPKRSIQCATPACSIHNPGCFVAPCEEKPFSTESFDGCGNRSNQRHDFTHTSTETVGRLRAGAVSRCAASLFPESGL